MKTKLFLLTLIFALLLTACGSAVNSQEQKWQAQNINHYRMQVHVSCFCAFMDKMPITVEVQNGVATSILDANGQPLVGQEDEWLKNYFTVTDLFAFAKTVTNEAEEVTIEYDPTYGFPSSINVDYIKLAMDDEISITVQNFEVLP